MLPGALWADVVFLQKVLFREDYLGILMRFNDTLVFDFDDAMYAVEEGRAEQPGMAEIMESVRGKLANTLCRSRQVIAGNDTLAAHARIYTDKVTVIPTSIDLEKYRLKPQSRDGDAVTIGWIGSGVGMAYLNNIKPVFSQLARKYGSRVRLSLVGVVPDEMGEIEFSARPWRLESEIEDLLSFDIGIMPLVDSERARGKSSCKAIQYMGVGIPTVCSPVGTAATVVRDGVNGFHASSQQEWREKLSLLVEDADLRQEMGRRGRLIAEQEYSIQSNAPRLKAVLEAAKRATH
jgi:glycosyltransferase involved in cell wall biosynthesis